VVEGTKDEARMSKDVDVWDKRCDTPERQMNARFVRFINKKRLIQIVGFRMKNARD
jgi:hypothetical protein